MKSICQRFFRNLLHFFLTQLRFCHIIKLKGGEQVSTQESKIIMAQNIKRYMELKGVTNQQLCEDLGFKYTTFMDWIKAVTYPRIGKIEAMAQYFGCEKSDLIEKKVGGQYSGHPTNFGTEISKIIQNYCIEHNLSFEQFAKVSDFSIEQIATLIHGVDPNAKHPGGYTLDTLGRLVNAMQLDPSQLPSPCPLDSHVLHADNQFIFIFPDGPVDLSDGLSAFANHLISNQCSLDGRPLSESAKQAILSAFDLGLQAARSKNKENE